VLLTEAIVIALSYRFKFAGSRSFESEPDEWRRNCNDRDHKFRERINALHGVHSNRRIKRKRKPKIAPRHQ
jgi:hypothetical protein